MESAAQFMCVLASSSLWLAGSGLALWLCLRSRPRLSPATRAAASLLVALQGWIWIGIPVQLPVPAGLHIPAPLNIRAPLDTVLTDSVPIRPWPTEIPSPRAASINAAERAMPLSSGLRLSRAATSIADVLSVAAAAAALLWMAGIALLVWRSIYAFVALSRMVQALPLAKAEWQNELSALCGEQKIRVPLVLQISNVAAPMLVQTWGRVSIVVPAWLWESCTANQRTSILLHELAHYQRGDIWRQLAMRLLILPHWFNPVAWWAAGQFEAASEAACDEAACGGEAPRAIAYSKALLVLNERIVDRPLGIRYAHALAISGSSLTERIRRILHPEFQKESQMSRIFILSALLVLAGLATIRIQAAGEPPPSKNGSGRNEPADAPGPLLRRRIITEEYERAEPAKELAGSLLANGGFEEAQEESNDPAGWFGTRVPQTAGHFLLSVSKAVAHSGKRSVVVEIADSHPNSPVHYNWTADAKEWKAGETYELAGWVKVEKAKNPAFIMAQFLTDDGKRVGGQRMIGGATTEKDFPVKGTTDWTRVSTRLKVPEGTSVVRIRAGLSSQGNSGAKAWLDDLSLVKVTSN